MGVCEPVTTITSSTSDCWAYVVLDKHNAKVIADIENEEAIAGERKCDLVIISLNGKFLTNKNMLINR